MNRQPINVGFWVTQILWGLFWITLTVALTALLVWAGVS